MKFLYLALSLSLLSNLYAQDLQRSVNDDGRRRIVSVAIPDDKKTTYMRFSDYNHDGKVDQSFEEHRYENSTEMLTVSDTNYDGEIDSISAEEWDFLGRDQSSDVKDFLGVDNKDFYFYTHITYQDREEFFLEKGKLKALMTRKEINGVVREQAYEDDNCDGILDNVKEFSGNNVENHVPSEEDRQKFSEYVEKSEKIKSRAGELKKKGEEAMK